MQVYEAKLRALGKAIAVHWFAAGHVMGKNEQSLDERERQRRFAYQILPRQPK